MRKNQLVLAFERFGSESGNGTSESYRVYSDGNDFPGTLARALEKIRAEYYPKLDRESFYAMLAEQDTEAPFLGRCETCLSKSAMELRAEDARSGKTNGGTKRHS